MSQPRNHECPLQGEPTGHPPSAEEVSSRLAMLPESMSDYAIFLLDAAGRVQTWNPGAERISGYNAEEITGRHFSVFYPPEQIATDYPNQELAGAAEYGFYIDEGWRVRKDGSRYLAHVVMTAQRSPDGALTGFIKVVRNITEARERERRSHRRFIDLFHLAPVGIAVLDDTERVLGANDALCELLERELSRFYSKDAVELLHPSDSGEGLIAGTTEDSSRHRRTPQRELARADGTSVTCDTTSALSVQEDGTRFWLVAFQDVSERVRHAEQLHHQATHDDLTGLPNRAGLDQLFARLRAGATGRIAGLFCDIDNFKRVNDSLGHAAGDELLSLLAKRLRSGLPESCTAVRLSGDEFLIVCSDVEALGGPQALTDWVVEFLHTAVTIEGRIIQVSASVGAAVLDPSSMNADDLLRLADEAMLRAKSAGRPGRASLADPEQVIRFSEQVNLEEDLRRAIADDGLVLHYQPLVDHSGAVKAAEALVRWPHPERGTLAPNIILSVAEQGGIARDLDRWVLRAALCEASRWANPARIGVNLTSLLPTDSDFVDEVTAVIDDSGLDWHRVILEIVETALLDLPSRAQRSMIDLTERGAGFAIDDFGTGYSSLARLKDVPTQLLKLDRRFVAGVEHNAADRAIARAAVDIGRAMGRMCVAEGVETAAQFQTLADIGVDLYQGFLFSRPVPVEDFRLLVDVGALDVPS